MSTLTSQLIVSMKDDVSSPAKKIAQALEVARKQVKALAAAGVSDRLGQQLTRLGLSAVEIEKVGAAWKKYAVTQKLAADASQWTRSQAAQVRAWENTTVASIRGVIRAEQALARANEIASRNALRPARGAAGHGDVGHGILGIGAAHGAKRFGERVLDTYKEFDDMVRYQRAVMSISPEEQKPLVDQAIKLGATTKFNDLQVLHAQLDLAQRGISRDVVVPITKAAASFGMALNIDLPTAAKTLEGILFSTGEQLHDGAEAIAAANKAASFATKLSKVGGLDEEDIRQFFKYGGASGHVAGLSNETMGAIAAILRRSNIRGDEAGVATRAFASKLVSPTNKGMAALATMGIDYNQFTKMPGGLSVENLNKKFKQDFGKTITEDQRKRLDAILEDPEKVADRGNFVSAVSDVLADSFAKTKKGTLAAKDQQALAKKVGDFHKLSTESVDSEGLLRAIIAKNPSLAVLNALFGEKQGGRAAIMAKGGIDLFQDYFAKLKGAGDSFHIEIAEQRMAGFAGAVSRAEGALMNFQTAVGRANDSLGTGLANTVSTVLNSLSGMPEPLMRFSTQVGAAAAALAGLKGFQALMGGFGLKSSATALDASAAQLTAAATALKGGAAAGAASSKLPGAVVAPGTADAAKPGLMSLLLPWAVYSAGREGLDLAFGSLPHPKGPEGYDPKAEAEKGTFSRIYDLYERTKKHIATLPEYRQPTAKDKYDATMRGLLAPVDQPVVTDWKRLLIGEAADPEFNVRKHFGIKLGDSPQPADAAKGDAATAKLADGSEAARAAGEKAGKVYRAGVADGGASAPPVEGLDKSDASAAAGTKTGTAFSQSLEDELPKAWPAGSDPAQFLDQSGAAGSAGAKTAEAFKTNFEAELRAVDQVIQQAMQRWGAMLGSFRASPSITPSISQPTGGGAAPAGGQKLGSLESLSAKQQAAFADYGFRTV